MTLSAAARREKGAVFEREVVNVLRIAGWPLAVRTHDGRIQAARGDVAGGPEGVHFELKRHEKLSVPQALDQIVRDAGPLDLPILVHRPSRHPIMATMLLEDLLPLLRLRERG